MDNQQLIQSILEQKIIVILRNVPVNQVKPVCEALYDGGIRFVEVTFNQASLNPIVEYETSINILKEVMGERMIFGAGTVLNKDQVDACKRLGGRFIISPNANLDVIRYTKEQEMVSIPGAMTPTEVVAAYEAGADIVKVFPAGDLGPGYLKSLKAPLSHIPMMATGGVSEKNIPDFLKAGADGFGISSSIVNGKLLKEQAYDEIRRLAKAHIAVL